MVKKQPVEAPILEHYDRSKKLSLATDASPYGVGAVCMFYHMFLKMEPKSQ